MIGFYLKKTLSFFLEPFGLLVLLFSLSLYFLFKNKIKQTKFFLTSAISLLLLFSFPPFSNFLINNLENKYQTYNYDANISYIHVLGHGNSDDPFQPHSSLLTNPALKRVVEGVIIHNKQPSTKLIFTGYEGSTTLSNAKANAQVAIELGVNPKDIITSGKPKDTKEEALFCKTVVKDKPFVLVTSATHLPRAMEIFHSIGLHPIPAPCDFKRKHSTYTYLPNLESLNNSQTAIHEYLGLIWQKLH